MTPANLCYVRWSGQPAFGDAMKAAGMRLLDLDPLQSTALEEALANSHVYHVSSGMNDLAPWQCVHDELLGRMPRLLLVSTIGAGHDPVDVAACTRHGVAVVNKAGGANAQAVVEHTLGLMLALGKRIVEADRQVHRAGPTDRHRLLGRNAQGRTVGIIGFGHVGRGLARACAMGLQMRVLVHSAHAKADDLAAVGAEPASLDALLAKSDYVAVCCSLSDATRGLIGQPQFAQMKPGAFFITTARGGIHDEAALHQALVSGHLAGAGVDVWDEEPPQASHPLLQLEQVIGSPHIGGTTQESREGATRLAIEQITSALAGCQPPNLLNPEVWPRFLERLAVAGLAPLQPLSPQP
jgi:D-3-phosphoglycerate dehydrogenase